MARRWLNTGVVSSYLNTLAVTADGTTLGGSVASGGAWIEGFYYESDAAIAFTVTTAHATLSRIDRVILRLDRTANTITQVVLAGTAAASPVAPTLTVTDTLWEIGLATVLVDPAVGVIAANKVTDTRVLTGTYTQGLNANRPTVGFKLGRFYLATDTDVLHFDDGTAWHPISTTATADAAYASKTNFPATAWTVFTPTLAGTGWAIGNGTITGRYRQYGKAVLFYIEVAFGSTSTYGAATPSLTVPVALQGGYQYYTGLMYHAAGASLYPLFAEVSAASGQITLRTVANPSAALSSTVPFTWASGCVIRVNGSYEAA